MRSGRVEAGFSSIGREVVSNTIGHHPIEITHDTEDGFHVLFTKVAAV